ncbi:MAG: dipeptidase E [Lachnospiraceae bacterium]|nr:dipeptidase E [Lachnospiraceae bacterium]
MVVFLTSSPCDDNVPKGLSMPCILDCRNEFTDNMRRWWKPNSVGIIIAAYPCNLSLNDEMRDTFEKAFTYHGLTFEKLIMVDARNDEHIQEFVDDSDFIMLAGGHVPTQNAYFKYLGLREKMKHFQGIVMGISAGSMNAADIVYVQPEEEGESIDPGFERFTVGLGLCSVNVLPHYQRVKDNYLDGRRLFEDITFEDSFGQRFIVLVDGSYVMVYDGMAEIYGESYLISDGKMSRFCEEGKKRLFI